METAISTLSVLPQTKEQIKSFVNKFISELHEGNIDLSTAVHLTAYEKVIKEIKDHKDYKEFMRKEAEKYGQLTELAGAKIELAEVGTKYDYSSTNDSELFDLLKKQAEIDAKVKARQEFLKNITGEVYGSDGVQLFAPIKTSTSSIKITLK